MNTTTPDSQIFSSNNLHHSKPFPHEQTERALQHAYQDIAILKQQLQDKANRQLRSVSWEIEVLHAYYPVVVFSYNSGCTIVVQKALTPNAYEQLLEDVEDILYDNGYEYDDNIEQTDRTTYFLHRTTNQTYWIAFKSAVCEKIPTGKLVPEYKQDCSFIKP